jgi:hypothetical protein
MARTSSAENMNGSRSHTDLARCRQIKDPQRNGGRNLELLREHLANDDLVAWGWNPATARDAVPGTQTALGELIRAWIDTGAECP